MTMVFKRPSTIETCKIKKCLMVLLIFFLSFVDILEIFNLCYHINAAKSICHPTNYEIASSIFSILTFIFMNEQRHISVCHFN